MQHYEFFRWSIDPRFFYVWCWHPHNKFNPGLIGPCLAITDDFGNLVYVDPELEWS